jgi:hypothetical protein
MMNLRGVDPASLSWAMRSGGVYRPIIAFKNANCAMSQTGACRKPIMKRAMSEIVPSMVVFF